MNLQTPNVFDITMNKLSAMIKLMQNAFLYLAGKQITYCLDLGK